MLEKSDLPDETIVARLRDSYRVLAARLEFLPLGNDPTAWAYRVWAEDQATYFLKLKRGPVERASLLVPRCLRDSGVAGIVAPLATASRELSAGVGEFTLLLYPFVDGRVGMEVGLSELQWHSLGLALGQIHAARLPAELLGHVRRETFRPMYSRVVRDLGRRVAAGEHDGPFAAELAGFWGAKRAEIDAIVERADALGSALRRAPPALVLCHADIHTANVLVDAHGQLWIVDWDGTLLAPKERDLMFIVGESAEAAEAAFFQGYGVAKVDPLALAYYRYEWVVQEIGDYGARVFSTPGIGARTLADAVEGFRALFGPGDVVEAAYASERLLSAELKNLNCFLDPIPPK